MGVYEIAYAIVEELETDYAELRFDTRKEMLDKIAEYVNDSAIKYSDDPDTEMKLYDTLMEEVEEQVHFNEKLKQVPVVSDQKDIDYSDLDEHSL